MSRFRDDAHLASNGCLASSLVRALQPAARAASGARFTMHTHVFLSWPALGVTARCALLEDVNPRLCASLRRALPLVSVQTHAVVAGEQIYFPTRLVLEDPDSAKTEDLASQPRGRINFDPFFQYISVNYGPISESVPAWPVAQVVEEDLARLPGVGRQIWQNLLHEDLAVHVIVSASQTPRAPEGEPRAFARPPQSLSAAETTAFLASEIDRIWLFEPRDARELRTGRAATHAGVGGQYFSPWVMATGLVRGLSVVDLPALRRMLTSEKIAPRAAVDLLAEFLRVPAGVIGYFGLPELGAVLEAVRASCPRFGSETEELRRLLEAFSTYLNRYNLWLHQGFPWRLGDGFRR